jgi:hypothetical protein
MYTLSELRKAIRHPIFLLREANILYHSRLRTTEFNESGTDIFEEDWDNLVLLDACRYDLFAETVDLDGRLESRISRGATSPEFIRGNFTGAELHDTVYVTGNGWYFKLRDEIGAELHAERQVEHDGLDPTPITDAALEAAAQYPNKRLLVHYMHPHYPYLGETATGDFDGFDLQADGLIGDIQRREVSIPDEVMRQAYVETLDAVLDEVAKLLDVFEGKTVVSADHGELLGDRCFPLPVKDYAHHGKLYVEELVKVPWFVHESGQRKDVVAEPPERKVDADQEAVDERLRKLGYKL